MWFCAMSVGFGCLTELLALLACALQYRANISRWKACASLLSSKLCRLCWWMKSSECKMLSNLPSLTALLLLATLHPFLHFSLLPRCGFLPLQVFAYCITFPFLYLNCFILKCSAFAFIKDKHLVGAFNPQWHTWPWQCNREHRMNILQGKQTKIGASGEKA